MKRSRNQQNQQLAMSLGLEFTLPGLAQQLNKRASKNPRKHRHHDALRRKDG